METLKDGTRFNPSPVCQGKECPEKSCARIFDLTEDRPRWKDLCYKHTTAVKRVYKDQVEVRAAWNGHEIGDFDE